MRLDCTRSLGSRQGRALSDECSQSGFHLGISSWGGSSLITEGRVDFIITISLGGGGGGGGGGIGSVWGGT